jgi:hypothetical protein
VRSEVYLRFGGISHLHHQGDSYSSLIELMMEAANTSETSEKFYQTAWHNKPEDTDLNIRGRENSKFHLLTSSSFNLFFS